MTDPTCPTCGRIQMDCAQCLTPCCRDYDGCFCSEECRAEYCLEKLGYDETALVEVAR